MSLSTRFFLWMAFFVLLEAACNSSSKEPYTNRLVNESSLYLRQHAHNPVDWYPWGEEALEKARAEGKLLLISIGYSSCHWCHVMEEETFSDTAVARYMNEHFVCIKVDREERPDIDDIYMTACQYASDQPCGWPLNAMATPDAKPVWAGTYFPKKQWMNILEYFADLYRNEPQKVFQYASELTRAVSDLSLNLQSQAGEALDAGALRQSIAQFKAAADTEWGGRMGAPKFPMPVTWSFLLAWQKQEPDPGLLELIHTTLDRIALGGIYDQLGGGFHRYATDGYWKVPHFEKMLYDNAQLVSLYSQAYRHAPNPEYERIIRQTLAFIAREMTSPEGGFYASFDADSEGEEGAFYVWDPAEVEKALNDPGLYALVMDYYQMQTGGNWAEGTNILFPKDYIANYAREKGRDAAQLTGELERARQLLFDARSEREAPRRDDKILSSWNALMLEAHIEAWRALGDEAYLQRALANASLIRDKMMEPDGSLYRTYAGKKASIPAFLDDYALVIQALVALYEVTFDEQWLQLARAAMQQADERFWDPGKGIYYYTQSDHGELVARRAEIDDNVIPASNSVMARNAFRLHRFFPEEGYEERARAMLGQVWAGLSAGGDLSYYANWSRLYLDLLHPPFEIAVVGPEVAAKRDSLQRHFLPNAVWMGSETESELDLLKGKYREGMTQIFVCRNRVCRLPVEYTAQALEEMGEQ